MKTKKKITMEQFCECIPSEQIDMVMGKREAKRYWKWMSGQTRPIGGVFTWDLERYLKGLPVID
jgi:hypothetical protein